MTAPSPAAFRPVIAAMLGSLGLVGAHAQIPTPAPTEIRPEAARPPAPPAPPVNRDTLKERDKELEAIRAEHRRTLENEAKLKREIESIGDDRRKLNQQLIDTAARVVSVEERIAKTQERLKLLDGSEAGVAEIAGAAARRHHRRCWRPCSAWAVRRRPRSC